MEALNKLLGMLGLARRAGRIAIGTDMVCQSLKSGDAVLCILANDASKNTSERVNRRCTAHGVKCVCPNLSRAQIAHAIGKKNDISAIAVDDENFAKAIENILNSCEERNDG